MIEHPPHDHQPVAMHQGDCAVCGNLRQHPLHFPTTGEARMREIAHKHVDCHQARDGGIWHSNNCDMITGAIIEYAAALPPGEGVMEALRAALKPFSVHADCYEGARDEDSFSATIARNGLRVKHLRAARAALSRLTQGGDAGLHRCEVCNWPLAKSAAEGCVPGNCSYRPEQGSPEWLRIQNRRRELADLHRPHPTPCSELSGAEQGVGWENIRKLLADCENDFHVCDQCSHQDDDATRHSNLYLILKGWVASPSPNPNASK